MHIGRRKTPTCDNWKTISDLPVTFARDVFGAAGVATWIDYEGVWALLTALMGDNMIDSTCPVFFNGQHHITNNVKKKYIRKSFWEGSFILYYGLPACHKN